jgi:hypothetical protein
LTTWYKPYYSIVIFPWFSIVLAESLRRLTKGMSFRRSVWLRPRRFILLGLIGVGLIVVVLKLAAGSESRALIKRIVARDCAGESKGDSSGPLETTVTSRGELCRILSRLPGQHLVFVRYEDGYSIHDEWVYNGSDLTGTPILLAHDLGEEKNKLLMTLYPERLCWQMEVGNERKHLSRLNK